MEERKGDFRIYVVAALIFLCVASGGVFLFLYIFLPQTQYSHFYPILGMILVAIPWAFWLFVYLYSCLKFKPSIDPHPNACSGSINLRQLTKPSAATPRPADPQSPSSQAQRHVHFGAVVVMGSGGGQDNDATSGSLSVGSRESEVPLKLSSQS